MKSPLAKLKKQSINFTKSIWLFPVMLLIPLVVLTTLGIHGSSIGTYYQFFNGEASKDPNLLLNKPRPIRSDEWLVTTQKTIIQSSAGFPRVNQNIANGEDVSIQDLPYKEWSTLLRPHNLAFFVLPLENAFAFKWLFMGYLLICSCYFFTLALLPKKRLFASLLSLALFYSPFVQWWYTYGTLSSIYYSLFIATAIFYQFKQTNTVKKIMLSILTAYLVACFAIVLYPPFQIACGLVLAAFIIGLFLENYSKKNRKLLLSTLFHLIFSFIIAVLIVLSFVFTRLEVIKTINNTVYPGNRSYSSGVVPVLHFFSSQDAFQFLFQSKTSKYLIDGKSPLNQSETSNFILISPFLILPSLYLLYAGYKKRRVDKILLTLVILFAIFMLELFFKPFTPVSKLLLLNQVGGWRSLIGIGLLNFMLLIVFVRNLLSEKKNPLSNMLILAYTSMVLIFCLMINFFVYKNNPGFITPERAIAFSLFMPIVLYLLLKRRIVFSIIVYLFFALFSSFAVNPIYRGLDIITDNLLSREIRTIGSGSNAAWISDGGYLQQISSVNGERSITGIHFYPQLQLWGSSVKDSENIYNRYAHVGAVFTKDGDQAIKLNLVTPDNFYLLTDDCSPFLKQNNVKYVVTASIISEGCFELEKTVSFPTSTFYIYTVN